MKMPLRLRRAAPLVKRDAMGFWRPPGPTERTYYLAAALLSDRIAGVGPVPVDLARAELRVSSQNGEDGILAEIFRRIGAPADPFFVEFGGETGSEGNCVFLADVLGWRGAFLEADPDKHRMLASKYVPTGRVRTRCALVTPDTIDDLFASLDVPAEPDVLSIDIDGVDYWVWRALVRHRPRVMVVEYNSGLGADDALTVPEDFAGWDGFDYYGASIAALRRLGDAKGYTLVHTDLAGANAFFVRDEDAAAFPEPVVVRGPNFFLKSMRHLPDVDARSYVKNPPV